MQASQKCLLLKIYKTLVAVSRLRGIDTGPNPLVLMLL